MDEGAYYEGAYRILRRNAKKNVIIANVKKEDGTMTKDINKILERILEVLQPDDVIKKMMKHR